MMVTTFRSAPLGELVSDAVANLYALRQRSALALLGIVIGTASVVAMLTIGHIAEQEALRLFSHMGIDMLVVQADSLGSTPAGLDLTAVKTLSHRLPEIAAAGALIVGHVRIDAGRMAHDVGVAAATPILQSLAGLQLETGRFIAAVDDDNLVAVVGALAATELSVPGNPIQVGQPVRVGHYVFTVIGVLRKGPTTAFDPTDFNTAIIVPLASGQRALSQATLNAAMARMRPGTDAAAGAAALNADMKRASPRARLQVQNARQLVQTLKAEKAVHTRLLSAIGGISLLVGGIGVMNVMLMGVMERRREIGLRAAIGATPMDIQLMFLVEAAVMAFIGGVTGSLLGVLAAFITAVSSGWVFSLALYTIPLGSGVATFVGLAFGLYPAVKASQLSPIEALRVE